MPGRWNKPSGQRCPDCNRPLSSFGRCNRRRCPGNAYLWAGDWRVSMLANLGELEDGVDLITITAPGADQLPWDRSRCQHGPAVSCSGKIGCRVDQEAAEEWNRSCESRLSRLHRRAAARARRSHGSGTIVGARTWEPQQRGVQHAHIGAPARNPRERARNRAYVAALKELGEAHGFGFADVAQSFEGQASGIRAAAYVGKYISKSAGESAESIRRPAFVGRELTTRTGITMRVLRWRRFLYRALGCRPSTSVLPVWVQIFKAAPGFNFATCQPNGP